MNMDIKLTEHFTLQELCRSRMARRQKIPNVPLGCHIIRLKNLCEKVLEPTRQHFGIPIRITSGYRCEAVNKMVGGSQTSQHITGEAADFQWAEDAKLALMREKLPTLREVWEWMKTNVPYDQLILESRKDGTQWIHVSCRIDMRKNRKQAWEIY